MFIVSRSALRESLRLMLVMMAICAPVGLGPSQADASSLGRTASRSSSPPSTQAVSVKGKVVSARDWLDYLQVAVVVAGLISVILIAVGQGRDHRASRVERAADVGKQWSDRDFLTALAPVFAFLTPKDTDDCVRKMKAWV